MTSIASAARADLAAPRHSAMKLYRLISSTSSELAQMTSLTLSERPTPLFVCGSSGLGPRSCSEPAVAWDATRGSQGSTPRIGSPCARESGCSCPMVSCGPAGGGVMVVLGAAAAALAACGVITPAWTAYSHGRLRDAGALLTVSRAAGGRAKTSVSMPPRTLPSMTAVAGVWLVSTTVPWGPTTQVPSASRANIMPSPRSRCSRIATPPIVDARPSPHSTGKWQPPRPPR